MARSAQDERLHAIIRPLKESAWTADFPWAQFHPWLNDTAKEYGGVDMVPDFQRGHVWTKEQQLRYIEAAFRNLLPPSAKSVQFNCANWNSADKKPTDLPRGLQCMDGLQRVTAVDAWLAGEFKPFGLSIEDLDDTQWMISKGMNLKFRFNVAIYDYTTRAQVLQHYLDFNAGGTPHSAEEIARVRQMLEEAKS